MKPYMALASDEMLRLAIAACRRNGLQIYVADTILQAKQQVLDIVPEGAEVFTATSTTLDALDIPQAINESGKYISVREKLRHMDPPTQKKEMRRLATTPDWMLGSVQAVTEDGHLHIASNTGSQLAGEVYGAEHVLFVVGTQKIVSNDQEAIRRIYEYVLPLEDERALVAYGINSFVSKLLIINREFMADRVVIVFIRQKVGF
jgi:hypothetical protein